MESSTLRHPGLIDLNQLLSKTWNVPHNSPEVGGPGSAAGSLGVRGDVSGFSAR